jgi:hypothetical protein
MPSRMRTNPILRPHCLLKNSWSSLPIRGQKPLPRPGRTGLPGFLLIREHLRAIRGAQRIRVSSPFQTDPVRAGRGYRERADTNSRE